MADYDAIVVGAGLAGSTAGYCMARAGLSVLILERGDAPGSKNVTGGRLYGHSLEKVFPGFAEEAPIERMVTREVISMTTDESCLNIDFHSTKFAGDPKGKSYTVQRAVFDQWLADKAEAAGCDVVYPARVDEVLKENGKVVGVRAGEDELTADVVILADGVNSPLARSLGLKKELEPHHVAVGAKQVIELSEEIINERFGLRSGEGLSRLFAGSITKGMVGGGFLYTNRETVSLGLVVTVSEIMQTQTSLPEMLTCFCNHPNIKPRVQGGKMVEYSAHLVPEGGLKMTPSLVDDGLLVTGDAAGFCVNVGFTVRGMDFAIESGRLAAEAAISAYQTDDFSAENLKLYQFLLDDSFIMKDLYTYRNALGFIEKTKRVYRDYPEITANILYDMFRVDGSPAVPVRKKMLPQIKKVGLFSLIKDGLGGMRAI
jgi:electron transfer flavoprotein-quinone oxidoreductase